MEIEWYEWSLKAPWRGIVTRTTKASQYSWEESVARAALKTQKLRPTERVTGYKEFHCQAGKWLQSWLRCLLEVFLDRTGYRRKVLRNKKTLCLGCWCLSMPQAHLE